MRVSWMLKPVVDMGRLNETLRVISLFTNAIYSREWSHGFLSYRMSAYLIFRLSFYFPMTDTYACQMQFSSCWSFKSSYESFKSCAIWPVSVCLTIAFFELICNLNLPFNTEINWWSIELNVVCLNTSKYSSCTYEKTSKQMKSGWICVMRHTN